MNKFLLVVFDGLRPDMVRPDTTPNLMRFAAMGTGFTRARSVFPSETRVCSASVATGCLPRRHGLVANRIPNPLDTARSVDTGHKAVLQALEQETGAALLDVPTLAQILAAAGRGFAVFSSGTTGQTYVLNPSADALGQVTLSAHGPEACSEAGRRLLARLDPPPAAPTARAVWLADAFRARILPDPPDASVLWLCEPDTAGHYDGLGSAGQLAALAAVDAAFGRLVDAWRSGPWAGRLQIMVASDHGHAAISGLVDVGARLAGSPAEGMTFMAGSSCGLAMAEPSPARVAAVAGWLMRQDWCGAVYVADADAPPPGALPRSLLLADHARAAPVLFTLRGGPAPGAAGLPGTTLYDGGLAVGGGTHGGLLPAELHTVLMLAGGAIATGTSDWPASLVDIAPTVLALLGLPGAEAMDGRVLGEALRGGSPPELPPAADRWEAAGPGYSQHLARTRLGEHVYLDGGWRG